MELIANPGGALGNKFYLSEMVVLNGGTDAIDTYKE